MTSPALTLTPGLDRLRDRRQVEVLREDGAAAVREPDVEAAVVLVRAALDPVDDAVVGGVDRLAPDLAAEVDTAVAAAALGRPVAGPLGAEHAPIADWHAPHRSIQRMEPGVGGDLGLPLLLGRRPRRTVGPLLRRRRPGRRDGGRRGARPALRRRSVTAGKRYHRQADRDVQQVARRRVAAPRQLRRRQLHRRAHACLGAEGAHRRSVDDQVTGADVDRTAAAGASPERESFVGCWRKCIECFGHLIPGPYISADCTQSKRAWSRKFCAYGSQNVIHKMPRRTGRTGPGRASADRAGGGRARPARAWRAVGRWCGRRRGRARAPRCARRRGGG